MKEVKQMSKETTVRISTIVLSPLAQRYLQKMNRKSIQKTNRKSSALEVRYPV